MKHIHLLGATGSIGSQTLEIIRHYPDRFRLVTLSFHQNMAKGIDIIREFQPQYVSVGSKDIAEALRPLFPHIQIEYGINSLVQAAAYDNTSKEETIVVTAVVGSAGLLPTLEAIRKGYTIALANKETLVTAGELIMKEADQHQVKILPVDSEHSAIFQALHAGRKQEVRRLILTASGGALRDCSREELEGVTVEMALNHPNWKMGAKITIDSATMMNKGFEVIEAHHLFQVPYERIDVVIHRESIIHSMVEYFDHSVIAQLGTPDMRIPIQYALTYPERWLVHQSDPIDFLTIGSLRFEPVDFTRYPLLNYAYEAGRMGGTMPVVLNSSNDVAVRLFLEGKITFLEIEKIVYHALEQHTLIKDPDLQTILSLDRDLKAKISQEYER